MDLACFLAEEIKKLNLTDELSIARYLYIKTGELFDYDMAYLMMDFSKPYEKERLEKIKNQEVDIHNVTSFNLVCTSWAKLYVALLTYFGIKAETIDSDYHSYVNIYLKGYEIIADMMIKYEDIRNIKFGINPSNFLIVYDYDAYNKIPEIDKKIKFFKGINPKEVIHKLVSELQEINDPFMCLEKVLETVSLITNINRPHLNFYSGFSYLKKLLIYFMDTTKLNPLLSFYCYADEELTTYKGFIKVNFHNNLKYYIYEKNSLGFYNLIPASANYLETLPKSLSRVKEM